MDILEYTKGLRTERMKLINEAKTVFDEAIEAKRAVTGEEQAKVDKIDERIAEIEAEVRTHDERARREDESAKLRESFDREYGTDRTVTARKSERRSTEEWMRGKELRSEGDERGKNAIRVNLNAAARELQAIRAGATSEDLAELRSILWDGGSSGGSLLVPVTLSHTLYQYMEASIAMFRMPTRKIQTSSGEKWQFPKLGAHAIATQVAGQGTALAGTDPSFARMDLDAFKYGELTQVSSEMIQDEVVNIIDFVGQDLGRAVGRVIDTDLVTGSGSGKPQGVMTAAIVGAAGTVATGGSLITPTYENLVDLVYSVNDEYRSSQAAAWLMRDATAGILRKLRSDAGGTSGPVLWEPSLTNGIQGGQPDRLLGFPVYTDPNVASCASNAKIMAFGDFSAYYIREVGDFVLERSDDYAFNVDLVTFRGKWRVDGDVIDTTALNILKQSV